MDRFSKCIVAARSISKCVISNHSFLIVVCFYANVNTAISIFSRLKSCPKFSIIFCYSLMILCLFCNFLQKYGTFIKCFYIKIKKCRIFISNVCAEQLIPSFFMLMAFVFDSFMNKQKEYFEIFKHEDTKSRTIVSFTYALSTCFLY